MKDTKNWLYKIVAAIVPILLEWLAALLTNPGSGDQEQEKKTEKSPTGLVGT